MTDELHLRFDPRTLPTAQHRAGLAGLVLTIRSLRRRTSSNVPEYSFEADGTVDLKLTKASLQAMLDHLYSATTQLNWRKQARKDKQGRTIPPIAERTVSTQDGSGKTKEVREFAYEDVVPGGLPLVDLNIPPVWLKLWQETIWSVLRAIPTTRGPYEGRSVGEGIKEAITLWNALSRAGHDNLKGHLYIGAQRQTADGVPYVGRAGETLLLHFWPIVMGLGCATSTTLDKQRQPKPERVGYIITMPDVQDIEAFCEDFSLAIPQLPGDVHQYFKSLPKAAVLAIPQEGGLDYLTRLLAVAKARAKGSSVSSSLSGTEVYLMRTGGRQPILSRVTQLSVSRQVLER